METVYFVLGMVTVLLLLGIVVIVKINESVKKLIKENEDQRLLLNAVERELLSKIDNDIHNLNSKIDSRTDKIENKIKEVGLLKS